MGKGERPAQAHSSLCCSVVLLQQTPSNVGASYYRLVDSLACWQVLPYLTYLLAPTIRL